ncbi:EAL domain-containing protein [Pantoea ananatis]|uniref:EAL domain-containing protein n=1 Tax=Pantoea ananas TaxID=553 RepID=UPI0007DABC71|nr:EAL domain-containing protein [Pantoea ananatis]
MYYIFEPVYLSDGQIFAYECLTRLKKPLSNEADYYEDFFKNATAGFLTSLAEKQIEYIVNNYHFLSDNALRATVNIDLISLKALSESGWKSVLDKHPLINFEVDMIRNFPVKECPGELLRLYRDRLWLDDASPENIYFVADALQEFSFIKIDKSSFWLAQKNHEDFLKLEKFNKKMLTMNIKTVAEGVDCLEYKLALKKSGFFAGQGYYWPALTDFEIRALNASGGF